MTSYTCLLVEENDLDSQAIQQHLHQLPILTQIDVCPSVREALSQLTQKPYDLVFLDIHQPGQAGLGWLRSLAHRLPVIITTAHAEYAVACYDLNVADFLLKPFSAERLQRAITRALIGQSIQQLREQPRAIFLYVNRQLQKFSFEAINYLEAHGAYTKIYTQTDVLLICESISALEERLPPHQFMRIQKSFIINLDKLTALERRFVWLSDIKLPIGKNYHDGLAHWVYPSKPPKDSRV